MRASISVPAILLIIVSSMISVLSQAQTKPDGLPIIDGVPVQPLRAQSQNLTNVLDSLGSPLPQLTLQRLEAAYSVKDDAKQAAAIQSALDTQCLLAVQINPESRVSVAQGPTDPQLIQGDWRLFLIKIVNQAGVTAPLHITSPNLLSAVEKGSTRDRWIDLKLYSQQNWISYQGNDPVPPTERPLGGLAVEYRIVQVYSKDAGIRQAKIRFDVGQGTQDLGFRNEADIIFHCLPVIDVTIHVLDEKGLPTTAMLQIRDRAGRLYPSAVGRIAPDFFFQPQVYRADGEEIRLPAGDYTIQCGRGPEYLSKSADFKVDSRSRKFTAKLERWIDPSKLGWWSGDHHIHAAGCRHYTNPTAGVSASDMVRSCIGEDLKVGCNLTWGPCFDYQKQFFTGKVDKASKYPYLVRYDVEVSGFGSHESGHLCLLRLQQEIYPGGDSYKHWPKLGLSTLRWAKQQGAVCGPAHSGFGLESGTQQLPNFVVPKFNGIGANEYIVDVTHMLPGPGGALVPAVDFMSTCDTPFSNELNIWYHTLNCGYRTRISGETDFPCISGERVGKGRSYVKLGSTLDFDAWCEGIRQGRCYVSDGTSHLIDFTLNGTGVGTNGSEVNLSNPGTVRITCKAAGFLSERAPEPAQSEWYWNLEHARIGKTRTVPVEVVVNGVPVDRKILNADGKLQDLSFDVKLERSSWVALRILGSSHSNPIFVLVGEKPIRASKKSAQWCLDCVEQCWRSKQQFYSQTGETPAATAAFEHAREEYRKILAECAGD